MMPYTFYNINTLKYKYNMSLYGITYYKNCLIIEDCRFAKQHVYLTDENMQCDSGKGLRASAIVRHI